MFADYVLTTFSPAMFGEKATTHIRIVDHQTAQSHIDQHTKIIATRVSHDRLARQQLTGANSETGRFAQLKPGVIAIHLHYRGPHINDEGTLPLGGMCTFFLIEVEEYQVEEA